MARGKPHSATAAAQPSGHDDARAVWRSAALVFLVALAVRLTHLWYLRRAPFFSLLMGDSLAYDTWAQRIASGDWLGTEVFYQAPLYPYLLGIFYRVCDHDLVALRVAQVVIGSAGCSLLTLAGGRLFSARAGLAAGLLLGVFPVAVYFDALLQKTVLDAVLVGLLLVAIAGLVRRPTAVSCLVTGVVLGCLALTRENTLLCVVVLLAWIWISCPRRLVLVFALVVGIGAVLAPVAIRNLAVGGELHLTTSQLGSNLYIGNSEKATGTYVAIRSNRGSATYERRDATELAESAAGRSLRPSEVSWYWVAQSLAWVSRNPARWLDLMARKFLLVWNATEASDTEDVYTHADWSPVLRLGLRFFDFGVLAPLGLFGAWLTRARWRTLWPIWVLAAVYAVSVSFFYVLDRYRYPLVPFLVLFAGAGIAGAPTWWRASTRREKVGMVVAIGLVATACRWPLLSKTSQRAATQYNVGVALQQEGRDQEAMAQYRAALALVPELSVAHSSLGVLLAAQGEREEAERHYREALEADPTMGDAHNYLGILLASTGREDEALANLRRAVELEPRNPGFWYNLGTALAEDHADEAVRAFSEAVRLEPTHAKAHNNLGILLASSGRLTEAVEHFQTALTLRPDLREAADNLARARAMQSASK